MLRMLIATTLICIMFLGVIPVNAQIGTVELFVAVNGNDSNPGTESKPFASLEGARSAVRSIIGKKGGTVPITVWFREGTYRINKSINFDANDSGTEQAPITYASYNNEKVIFNGSYDINTSEFRALTDEKVIALLPDVAKGKVGVINLRDQGIAEIPTFPIPTSYTDTPSSYTGMFLNGQEQPLSRWPNTGYTGMGKIVNKGALKRNGDKSGILPVFNYVGERPDRWTYAKDAIVEGFFLVDYAYERLPLGKVDTSNRTITIGQPTMYGLEEGKRFAVFNLLEEIDSPGEWYIDREKMLMYYYPPYTLNGTKMEISLFKDTMIKANKASDIYFKGLRFENTCGSVMELTACKNINMVSCNLNNIGRQGVVIKQGVNNNVIGCDISNIGGVCVYLDGGDRQTLVPGDNKVINNHFYNLGRHTKTYAGAVDIFGVGNIVENNLIHEAPHLAIRFSGNDHKIRYNEIYNVVKESLDAGAIYAGRNYTMRGNEISYNYIHDIETSVTAGGLHASAIYLDDQFSGTNVHHNILNNVGLAFMMGGGLDNNFENNIIINCKTSIAVDNRGEGWAISGAKAGGYPYNTLLEVPYNKSPYIDKYPTLATILDMFPGIPRGNVIRNNILVNSAKPKINENAIKYGKVDNNIELKNDPGFKNPSEQNYEINQESEILKQLPEFSEIPNEKIGLKIDQYRTNIEKPAFVFKQISPKNGQIDVNGLGHMFMWDNAQYADKYKIIVAEDPELKNVVYEGETVYNYKYVNSLEAGKKNYYWKVEAINYSKQIGTNAISRGQAYLFTSTLNDILNKDAIRLNIKNSIKALDAVVEGTLPGQYTVGAKAEFEKVLDNAKKAEAIKVGVQKQIEQADKALTDANTALGAKIVKGYVGIEDMMKDPADWVASNDSIKISNNIFTFSEAAKIYTAGFVKKPMVGYELLCFQMKTDLNGKWIGLGLKQNNPTGPVWTVGGSGYLIVVKADQIELQRFVNGSSEFLNVIPNTFINDSEWHDIQLGALNGETGIILTFIVDGKPVFNQIDEIKPIKDSGSFMLYDLTLKNGISLKAMDELPQGEFNSGGVIVNYAEPVEFNIVDILKNQELWKASSGKVTFNADNILTYVDSTNYSTLGYDKIIPNESIINMRTRFNLSNKWQGLGIRAKNIIDNPLSVISQDTYLVLVKTNSIELQRFNKGKIEILSIVDNVYIKNDELCDIKLGAYDVAGGVQLIFKVNEKTVFEYLDTMPLSSEGYFTAYGFNGANMDIAPAN